MSRDDDDQLLREKRTFDIMCVGADIIFRDFGYEEKGETSGEVATMEEKEGSTCGLINYCLRSTRSSSSSKRQKIDESENQNPNPDACSPSLCSVESKRPRHVVSNKVVRRKEPVTEIEPVGDRVTPEWLIKLMIEEDGTDEDAKLIIQKKLECTDLATGQARLLIPCKQIEDKNFLNVEELSIIDKHIIKASKKGVDVTLVDSKGTHWELNLRRWDMRTTSNYALCSGWNKVVAANKLRRNQKLSIWSFHSSGKLFLAFAPSDPAPALALPPAPSLHPDPVVTTSDSGERSSDM